MVGLDDYLSRMAFDVQGPLDTQTDFGLYSRKGKAGMELNDALAALKRLGVMEDMEMTEWGYKQKAEAQKPDFWDYFGLGLRGAGTVKSYLNWNKSKAAKP